MLKGRNLRVAFPGDDDSGYTILTTPAGQKAGSYVKFMQRLASENSFTFTEQPLSATSRALYPRSSFTACVHEVAIGNVDLCVGNFWITTERRLLGAMTHSVTSDDFYLVTLRRKAQSQYELVVDGAGKLFTPLEGNLWFAILAAVVYSAVCMFIGRYGTQCPCTRRPNPHTPQCAHVRAHVWCY